MIQDELEGEAVWTTSPAGGCYLGGWAVGSHTAGVRAQVPVLEPFVILRWRHRCHRGAVAEAQTLKKIKMKFKIE